MCKSERAKCVWPIVFAVLGAGLIISCFIIPYFLYKAVGNGFYLGATINTPQSNLNDYNHFISNSYSDSPPLYYSYYFWNCTNIDSVVLNNTLPTLNEVGPYTYVQYYQYYYVANGVPQTGVQFSADYSTATYAEADSQVFQGPSVTHPIYGYYVTCSGCSDTADRLYVPSIAYATLFFTASGALAYEGNIRAGVSALALNGLLTSFNSSLYSATGAVLLSNTFALLNHTFVAPSFGPAFSALQTFYGLLSYTISKNAAYDPYNALGTSFYASNYSVSFEFYNVGNAGGLDASLVTQTFGTYLSNVSACSPTLTQVEFLYSGPLIVGGTDFGLLNQVGGGGPVWLSLPANTIFQYLSATFPAQVSGSGLTANIIAGIQAWLQYQAVMLMNMLFDLEGCLGSRYVTSLPIARGVPVSYPSSSTATNFNNANLFAVKSPYQLLFQSVSLLGGILFTGKATFPQELGFVASSQRPMSADYVAPHTLVTINTGQVNVNQVDEIAAYSNGLAWGVGPLPAQTIFGSSTLLLAAGNATNNSAFCNTGGRGSPTTQTLAVHQSYFNGLGTRWTPAFPPGTQTSSFGFSSSIVSTSLTYNVFNSVIQRQVNFTYWFTPPHVQGITAYRYTIGPGDYVVDTPSLPGYGVISYAVGTYFCGGQPAWSSPPRWQLINGTDMLTAFSNALFYGQVPVFAPNMTFQSNSLLATYNPNADPNALYAWEDMEPNSGLLIRGSLKEQLNMVVFPWSGAANSSVGFGYPATTFAASGIPSSAPSGGGQPAVVVWPILWSDKHGELTSSQANSLKFAIGALTAAPLVLIIGTIVGGVQMFVSLFFVVRYFKNRKGYTTAPSQTSLTGISV